MGLIVPFHYEIVFGKVVIFARARRGKMGKTSRENQESEMVT